MPRANFLKFNMSENRTLNIKSALPNTMRLITLCFLIFGAALLAGCAPQDPGSQTPAPPAPASTSQPVEKISLLRFGISKQDVTKIMGQPTRTEFSGKREAWHFCRTGPGVDEFAVVLFLNEKVTGAKNYNVTVGDTGGVTGDCSKFVRAIL